MRGPYHMSQVPSVKVELIDVIASAAQHNGPSKTLRESGLEIYSTPEVSEVSDHDLAGAYLGQNPVGDSLDDFYFKHATRLVTRRR